MIILLNLISLNNNIAQFDDRAVRRPRGATTARHDTAGWTGKNLILDEALHATNLLKLKFRKYPAIHTNYIISHSTTLQYNHNI